MLSDVNLKINLHISFTLSLKECQKEDSCDSAFIEYIKYCHSNCNPYYQEIIIRFIIIFRESLNRLFKNEENKPYSSIYTAEKIPLLTQEIFLIYEDLIFDIKYKENIDLIKHFNDYLLINNLTNYMININFYD